MCGYPLYTLYMCFINTYISSSRWSCDSKEVPFEESNYSEAEPASEPKSGVRSQEPRAMSDER